MSALEVHEPGRVCHEQSGEESCVSDCCALTTGQPSEKPPCKRLPATAGGPKLGSSAKICMFFMRGCCFKGDYCDYSHDVGGLSVKEVSENWRCSICLECVASAGHSFAIQPHCDHIFCMPCLTRWRAAATAMVERSGGGRKERGLARRCPVCRKKSYVIIPWGRPVTAAEKEHAIKEHLKALATRPCKYITNNKPCPFGNRCFFSHPPPLTDGSPKHGQKSELSISEKLRIIYTEEGGENDDEDGDVNPGRDGTPAGHAEAPWEQLDQAMMSPQHSRTGESGLGSAVDFDSEPPSLRIMEDIDCQEPDDCDRAHEY